MTMTDTRSRCALTPAIPHSLVTEANARLHRGRLERDEYSCRQKPTSEPRRRGPAHSAEAFQPIRLDQTVASAGQNLVGDEATYRWGERNPGVHDRNIKSGDTSRATHRGKTVLRD